MCLIVVIVIVTITKTKVASLGPPYLVAFALREVEAVVDARHDAGDELGDGGPDHVREREDAEHEEIHREQQVDVLLAEHLECAGRGSNILPSHYSKQVKSCRVL